MSADAPTNADFAALELPSYVRCDATPELGREERGLRIAAPARLEASPGMRIPIAAAACITDDLVPLRGSLWDAVVAVVVDLRSNQAWAEPLADPYRTPIRSTPDSGAGAAPAVSPAAPATPAKPAPGAPTSSEHGVVPPPGTEVVLPVPGVREYGNFDLRRYLPLPGTPASYSIYLTLGTHQSNVARIDVVRPREGE